jgi:tetratricopeptide (TPR) repeat protein
MPFETARREPRSYWLGEGSAVILTDGLATLGLPVMSRDERWRSLEALHVPRVTGLSRATIIRVGQVVGVSHIVVGSFDLADEVLTVRARAILLDRGQMGPEVVEKGPLADIFAVYDRVAQGLVPGASATPEQLEASHPPIAAYEQYIKGLLAEAPANRLGFLHEALRLSPTLHEARTALWDVRNELGDNGGALAAVRPVPANHRLGRQAQFLASVSLLQLGQYQEAFDILTELNREGRDATLLNNLGVVRLRQPGDNSRGRAVAYFKEAASLDGLDSFFNLGYAYWLDGDTTAAIQWLREAVRRNPADDAAHYVLGVALDVAGSATEAGRERALARQLSSAYADWEAKPVREAVPRGLERVRMDLGLPAALRVENAIVAAGQRDQQQLARFYLEAGRRAYESQRYDEVIAELRRAVYLSPYDHEAHLLLGRAYLRGGRLSDAVSALKISIWSLDSIAARLALAEAYSLEGAVAKARTEVQAALALDPANVEARRVLDGLAPP